MLDQTLTLPKDPEELRRFTARLLAEVKAQAILIEKLRHQLAGHRAHRFGAWSETAEQLQLALETSEIAAAAMTARMRLPDIEENDKPKRRPIPDHVPRMEVELSPGADACADCGDRLRRIGEDVTEELEYIPGRFIVNRIVRPRLTCAWLANGSCKPRCRRARSSVAAPARASLPMGWSASRRGPWPQWGRVSPGDADHLPLYRQSQIFDREGLDLDRSTLADWVGKTTALLEPLADAIGCHVLSAEAIFADDTPISRLAPGSGKTQTARLWTYARDDRPWGGDAPPAAFAIGLEPMAPQWLTIASRVTARASTPRTISPGFAAGCMPTAMPGSRISTAAASSARSLAGPMSGASSSTSTDHKAPPSPKRPSAGSPDSRLLRRRPEAPRQTAALNCAGPMPPRSSTTWSNGWRCNSPRSRADNRWPAPSAMP